MSNHEEESINYTVRMFMSVNPLFVDDETSVVELSRKMAERGVGACFVEKGGKVVGIVTERDIVRKVVARNLDASRVKASEIMSTPIVAVEPDTLVEEALNVMAEKRIRRLAVVEKGMLVGIVTISDLAKALLRKVELVNSFVSAATRRPPMYG